MVLRDAEVHTRGLSANPAGAVPARCSRLATRDGLPLLPQLCRSGGAFEFAQYANVHELPQPGAEGQSKTGAGADELENWKPDRMGATASHARLRFLQSLRARQSRDQLF